MSTKEPRKVGSRRERTATHSRRWLPLSVDRTVFLVLLSLGFAGLVIGWELFWFMTDDAFIAFRYIENGIRGFGYVWNPPPFAPVEGYTSFLWVVLLEAVWRVMGTEPPQAANWISLLFTCLTLAISAEMTYRMTRCIAARWVRFGLITLLLGYLILNRSFLAWASSGLETALFDFLLIFWVFLLNFGRRTPVRLAIVSAVAAASALTRPDGLIFWAVTSLVLLLEWFRRDPGDRLSLRSLGTLAAVSSPLALVIIHLLWRRSFYGEWLPNTYYAKVVGAWPLSGAVYAFSFLLEFCLWPILALVAIAAVRWIRQSSEHFGREQRREAASAVLPPRLWEGLPLLATLTALLGHLAYYTLIVGGDHFEYRAYNHVFPLVFLSLVWAVRTLGFRPAQMFITTLLCVGLSLPVPWTHWFMTKDLNTRAETLFMTVPVSPSWPRQLRWYTSQFDRAQRWLIRRLVCCRHQEHKVFCRVRAQDLPSREQGQEMERAGYPVFVTGCVGIAGWVMPHACIIDSLALNDYVVARTPVPRGAPRVMAHDRVAPAGYLEDFRANVTYDASGLHVSLRKPPLTAQDIIEIEAKWREWVRTPSRNGR